MTLQEQINATAPGNTLTLSGSTFREKIIINKPITLVGVVVDGSGIVLSSKGDSSGSLVTIDSDNVVLKNVTVRNSDHVGIFSYLKKNILLDECLITGIAKAGILFRGDKVTAQNIIIKNSEFSHIQKDPYAKTGKQLHEVVDFIACNGVEFYGNRVHDTKMESIVPKGGCNNIRIHDNEVGPNVSTGIAFEEGWTYDLLGGKNLHAYNNFIHDSNSFSTYASGIICSVENCNDPNIGGTGDCIGIIENVHIYNNLIVNMNFKGISLVPYYTNGLHKDIFCYNNTIHKCGYGKSPGGGIRVDLRSGKIQNVQIINNIVNDCNIYQIVANAPDGNILPGVIVKNNLINGFRGIDRYSSSLGGGIKESKGDNAIIDLDPLFVLPLANDFHLQDKSPAINVALDVGITRDFDNVLRTLPYDLGAYEYIGPIMRKPIIDFYLNTKTGVGNLEAKLDINEVVGFSVGPEIGVSYWKWFNDGIQEERTASSHSVSWSEEGIHTMKVIAVNDSGESDPVVFLVTVGPIAPPPPPPDKEVDVGLDMAKLTGVVIGIETFLNLLKR